jgi:nucleoside 2-deoxyribosyltransferase
MAKRFYLATKKDRAKQADEISEALTARGWERTLTWSDRIHASSESHAELAKAELEAVRQADVLIVMLPGGYGTHVEIGAALALGKPVILHTPDQKTLEAPYPCVFHYHPNIKILVSEVLNLDDLVSYLSSCA